MTDGVFLQRVDLPSGGWADLRPAKAVSERQRRPVRQGFYKLADIPGVREAFKSGDTESLPMQVMNEFDTLNDMLAVAVIAGWSFGAPVTLDAVQDLDGPDYDALQKAVAPLMTELLPDFSASKESAADPKVTTEG